MDITDKIPSDFGPPFDDADADLTLRSSDMVDFHVSKSVLSKISTVLKDCIQSLTPNPETYIANRLILPLPESSRILHTLLSTIFPVSIHLLDSFDEMASALAASKKYGIESSTSVLSKLIRANKYDGPPSPWSIGSIDPFRAYFVACRYGLEEEAILAARLGRNQNLTIEQCVGRELTYVSGPELFALWCYRNDALEAMRKSIPLFFTASQNQHLWMTGESSSTMCRDSTINKLPRWLCAFLRKAAESFPYNDAMSFYQALSDHAWTSDCTHCKNIPPHTVRHLRSELDKVVTEAMDKIAFRAKNLGRNPRSLTRSNKQPVTPPPAFARPDADIILRSSDGIDFAVYKSTMALASPFFESMFSLPASATDNLDKPIVQMEENSKTLSSLLSMLFPVHVIVPDTIEDTFPVLAAAQKYEMDSASILLRTLFYKDGSNHITPQDAYRLYGLAFEYRLRDEAVQAARLTLHLPMTFDAIGRDLYAISGRALVALWRYRVAYLQALLNCFQEASRPDSSLYALCNVPRCIEPTDADVNRLPLWWSQFFENVVVRYSDVTQPMPQLDALRAEFCKAIPASHVEKSPVYAGRFVMGDGYRCQSCHRIDMKKNAICASLKKQADRDISKVEFQFDD